MKSVGIICWYLLAFQFSSMAQLTGVVNYAQQGISFEIPAGWKGQEGNGVIIMGSDVIPGIMILSKHTMNLQELISEVQQGISDDSGTLLTLSGKLKKLSTSAVAGAFSGTLDGQSAKAYLIGVENPYNGFGLMIMAATQPELYSTEHEKACELLFKSLHFSKVERSKEIEKWTNELSNVRLTYMNSYNSSSYGGPSGGYSSEIRIDLCVKGYFNYNSHDETIISGEGISGYDSDGNIGDGTWKIIIGTSGNPTLLLKFNNGEEYRYVLEYIDDKLHLNGDRFFRTTDGEYAPNCR